MSLDTKYRPIKYSDVLGQKTSVKTLKGLVSSGAGWRQSYLFAGPYGSGKTTLGRILARALLCESPVDGEPCDQCDSCLMMLQGSSPSFVEVDSATNSGKADVKKILEEIDYTSFSGGRKLYLFDEAHQLSKDALDALLKPMEENHRGTLDKRLVVIFATTEPEKMRQTILSRCAPAFIIHHVKSESIADRLEMVCDAEGFTHEREALTLIADISEGHIRDALKAVEGVASSNEGHIGVSAVRSYLHTDRNDIVCQLLMSDERETLSLCESLVESTPVGVAYERLVSATMLSVGLGLGSTTPPPYWNRELLTRAYDTHGLNLLSLAESLSSRPAKGLTIAMLKCDLLMWKVGGHVKPPQPLVNSVIALTPVSSEVEVEESNETKTVEKAEPRVLSVSAFASLVNSHLQGLDVEETKTTEVGDTRAIP